MGFRQRRSGVWVPQAPFILPHGRTREGELHLPRVGLAGILTAEVVHARTGAVRQRVVTRNLITDAALDAIGNGTSLGNLGTATNGTYVAVGTGNSVPTAAQTALDAEVARTTNTGGFGQGGDTYVGAEGYHRTRLTRVFTEAEANGNLTEFGVFKLGATAALNSGTMLCRQLFRDAEGNPTVVTKTAEDQLRLIYEVRLYHPMADEVVELTISGVPYTATVRPARVATDLYWGFGSGQFGAEGLGLGLGRFDVDVTANARQAYETDVLPAMDLNGNPSGSSSPANEVTWAAYVNGTFYRDETVTYNPSAANFGTGIGMVATNMGGAGTEHALRIAFAPKIPKTNLQRLRLTIRTSWGRVA